MTDAHKQRQLDLDQALADNARLQKLQKELRTDYEDKLAALQGDYARMEASHREGAVGAQVGHEETCRQLKKAHRDECAKLQVQLDEARRVTLAQQAQLQEQAELLQALGGTELGQKLRREAKQRQLQLSIEQAQQELQALEA